MSISTSNMILPLIRFRFAIFNVCLSDGSTFSVTSVRGVFIDRRTAKFCHVHGISDDILFQHYEIITRLSIYDPTQGDDQFFDCFDKVRAFEKETGVHITRHSMLL